jgi:hypothetical protein
VSSAEGCHTDFTVLTNELHLTFQNIASETNTQILIENLERTGEFRGVVLTSAGLMGLCLGVHGPSELSRIDLFKSQELKSFLHDIVMHPPQVPYAYCVLLPLPGVLDRDTLMNLKKKGRAIDWMPSFMCLRPMNCKAPDTWIMPSANFDFRCGHAPASPPGRRFCYECKAAQTKPHIADFVD